MICAADRRVEWEFWTSSNDGCGNGCNQQADFKKKMRDTAIALQKVIRSTTDPPSHQHTHLHGS